MVLCQINRSLLFFFPQNTRNGTHSSHSTSGGTIATGPGGTSGRPYGHSAGSGLSPDAYRRQHEITVTVSIGRVYLHVFVESLQLMSLDYAQLLAALCIL